MLETLELDRGEDEQSGAPKSATSSRLDIRITLADIGDLGRSELQQYFTHKAFATIAISL